MQAEREPYNHFSRNLPAFLISISPGSRAVYHLCLVLVAGLLVSLPLVRVQVSVTGKGIIRPWQEKADIIPSTSGMVEEIYVSEGDFLEMSDPILKLRSFNAGRNLQVLKMELKDTDQYIDDLHGMLSDPAIVPVREKYRTAWKEYCHHLEYLTLIYEKAQREWTRQTGLYNGGLISDKAYDDLTFNRNRARQERLRFTSESRRAWQEDHSVYLDRRRSLIKQIQQTEEQIRRSVIRAPVSGSLEEFSGIFPGSELQAGEVIGVISPDSKLIGELYMQSKDIVYLSAGQEVILQIDAFPSREWGMVKSEIYDISNDFIWLKQQAVYRVKCHLPKEGKLIKGMTFHARCLVAPRSLLQLLTDKADDWLNPSISPQTKLAGP